MASEPTQPLRLPLERAAEEVSVRLGDVPDDLEPERGRLAFEPLAREPPEAARSLIGTSCGSSSDLPKLSTALDSVEWVERQRNRDRSASVIEGHVGGSASKRYETKGVSAS